MKKIVLAAALLASFPAISAHAQSSGSGFAKGGWSAQYGNFDGANRATLNYETAPLWTTGIGPTHLDLTGELGVSYWWTQRDPTPGYSTHMWQLNAIPMFRWWPTDRFYLEAGVGATFVSEHKFEQKDISSTFLFGDHIGAGYRLTPNSRIGIRMSHFSNAGIKEPNQGVNSFQITYAMSF